MKIRINMTTGAIAKEGHECNTNYLTTQEKAPEMQTEADTAERQGMTRISQHDSKQEDETDTKIGVRRRKSAPPAKDTTEADGHSGNHCRNTGSDPGQEDQTTKDNKIKKATDHIKTKENGISKKQTSENKLLNSSRKYATSRLEEREIAKRMRK